MSQLRNFNVVELQQGTREWLEWRHEGIGASDASSVMGENRFRSTAQLLQEKREPARGSFQNEAMALGTRLEPEARRRYIAKTGQKVNPVCVQSTRYDWLRASLDGLATDHGAVVEIKCGASVYRRVSRSRSVPSYYYGQVQHILAITGLESLDFWCYWPDHPELLLPVERDDAYIERLLNRELEFWSRVQDRSVSRAVSSDRSKTTKGNIAAIGLHPNYTETFNARDTGEKFTPQTEISAKPPKPSVSPTTRRPDPAQSRDSEKLSSTVAKVLQIALLAIFIAAIASCIAINVDLPDDWKWGDYLALGWGGIVLTLIVITISSQSR